MATTIYSYTQQSYDTTPQGITGATGMQPTGAKTINAPQVEVVFDNALSVDQQAGLDYYFMILGYVPTPPPPP